MGALRLVLFAALAVIATITARVFVAEPIIVMSGSMAPTLTVGSRYLCDKLTLRLRPAARGDIVLFQPPTGADISVGKRVIAVAGETFELRGKKVYINGIALVEPYAVHSRGATHLVNDDLGPIRVPEGTIMVLGDNRDESEDSTVWKTKEGRPIYFVPVGSVTGLVRPWPLAGAS